jgi:hypothetical protein
MTKFVLCWHKTKIIEEVEMARADRQWFNAITCGHLDVLKIKDGKMYILDSLGGWSRVQRKEATSE